MKFKLDDMIVYFPFKDLYREQKEYMEGLKKILDQDGKGILEKPTGTGKTASLLSFVVSYQLAFPTKYKKLIYCTRTFAELEKTISELKVVVDYVKAEFPKKENERILKQSMEEQLKSIAQQDTGDLNVKGKSKRGFKQPAEAKKNTRILTSENILAFGISARRGLCINEEVSQFTEREKVDAECQKRTAMWARAESMKAGIGGANLCEYFENLENGDRNFEDVSGVYTLENMKALGRQKKLCPYFLAQRLIEEANIVVCNYPYLVDSRVSQVLYKRIGSDCIVIFDEAHNIDNICIDSLTVKLNKGILEGATFNWETIKQDVDKRVDMINENIQNEFKNLVDGLSAEERVRVTGLEAQEAVASKHIPGSIKKTEHFMSHLRLIITYLKNFIKIKDVRLLTPTEFLSEMCKQTVIDKAVFPFMELRYRLLMMSLQKTNLDELSTLSMICKFLSLLAENTDGFKIILEPYQDNTSVLDPLLQFCCLDSSIAMVPVFQKFKAVILTSGTISPLELYPQLLGFIPNVLRSIPAFLARNSISPMIVARGNDQVPITSEFSERGNQMVIRNYGALLIELSKVVPDGIIVFFPSYAYMRDLVLDWKQKGIIDEILKHKLIFIETKDIVETSNAMSHFREACRTGRGAIFLSVARGKVAEGVDFNNYRGRCVVMIGIPYQYSKSKPLLCRMEYLEAKYKIDSKDFLTFDAMRQCSQCLGRVIRSKSDYGLMILADKRYAKNDKVDKLPDWIKDRVEQGRGEMQLNVAIQKAKEFFRQMGQPIILGKELFYTPEEQELTMQEKNGGYRREVS